MAVTAVGKVGSKGELFPPKEVRRVSGLKPGDKVLYIASKDKIISIKVEDFFKLYKRKTFAKLTTKEFEEMTEEVLKI